ASAHAGNGARLRTGTPRGRRPDPAGTAAPPRLVPRAGRAGGRRVRLVPRGRLAAPTARRTRQPAPDRHRGPTGRRASGGRAARSPRLLAALSDVGKRRRGSGLDAHPARTPSAAPFVRVVRGGCRMVPGRLGGRLPDAPP